MIKKIHHIQITIPQGAEEEARRFYCDLLGLPEIEKPESLQGRGGFWLQVGGQQLHVGTEHGVERSATKAHLAYEVDDLAMWQSRLETDGRTLLDSIAIPGYERFETRDPFGNRLELIQPIPYPVESTKRFSNRVDNYRQYRPGYPKGILTLLEREVALTPDSMIADVGSGTGLLTELFLKNGNVVYAVEPNAEMRTAAETALSIYPHFHSIDATAEATTLPGGSVDIITAGQAFHWFDPALTKQEFARILRPNGLVVLVWNTRRYDTSPFLAEYEKLLDRYALKYQMVRHEKSGDDVLADFFAPGRYQLHHLENFQLFDYEGLQGRLLSSSYAPLADHPNHAPMIAELRRLFDEYQVDGRIKFEYETKVYYGRP